MLLQGLIAGLAAGAAVIGIYWARIKRFLSGRGDSAIDDEPERTAIDDEPERMAIDDEPERMAIDDEPDVDEREST